MFGYTSILNIGGVPNPVVSARDAENGASVIISTQHRDILFSQAL